jgi:hypothetical protein
VVVVGTDGSSAAGAALAFAADHATATDAALEIVCFTGKVTLPDIPPETTHEAADEVAQQALSFVEAIHPRLVVATRVVRGRPSAS